MSVLRPVRTVDAVGVEQVRSRIRQIAVPDAIGVFREADARYLVMPGRIEETQLDPLGILGEQREIDAAAIPGGAQRIRPARPELGAHPRLSLPRSCPNTNLA